jgi:hypothetical protein
MTVSNKLEVGDYFIIRNLPEFAESTTLFKKYQIDGIDHVGDLWFIDDVGQKNFAPNYPEDYDIQKLFFADDGLAQQTIARPVLEERKVGKVKMQLFDEGFPNAIMEIAKVMSWAESAKGYQPNDFKNLPNAETEFSAAASRHRVKGFIQKDQGIPAIERTDEESNIAHLAHAAFNVLAELELVLTGKIK